MQIEYTHYICIIYELNFSTITLTSNYHSSYDTAVNDNVLQGLYVLFNVISLLMQTP